MKIRITQSLGCYGDDPPYIMYKEFNSDIIPHKGDFIKDPVWDNPEEYKVIEVIIDYYNNACYVSVGDMCEDVECIEDFLLGQAKKNRWKYYKES